MKCLSWVPQQWLCILQLQFYSLWFEDVKMKSVDDVVISFEDRVEWVKCLPWVPHQWLCIHQLQFDSLWFGRCVNEKCWCCCINPRLSWVSEVFVLSASPMALHPSAPIWLPVIWRCENEKCWWCLLYHPKIQFSEWSVCLECLTNDFPSFISNLIPYDLEDV